MQKAKNIGAILFWIVGLMTVIAGITSPYFVITKHMANGKDVDMPIVFIAIISFLMVTMLGEVAMRMSNEYITKRK